MESQPATGQVRVRFPVEIEDGTAVYAVLMDVPALPAVMVESAVRGLAIAWLHRELPEAGDDVIERAVDRLTIEWGA